LDDNNSVMSKEIVLKDECVTVTGGTVELCKSNPVDIDYIKKDFITKIPVILAQFTVQFNISALIKLPEVALEIKKKDNKVQITQCTLIQKTNSLFIKGFIRENLEYSTIQKPPTPEYICGEIHHCIFNIPFEFTTEVDFKHLKPSKIIPITSKEFKYSKELELPKEFNRDKLIHDETEYNQINTEHYNDLPYCKIISSKIVNFNEYLNQKLIKGGPLEETVFEEIEEKMVVSLTLQILQRRCVKSKSKCD